MEIKLTKTPVAKLARGLTTFRELFAQLGPSAGLLLSLTSETRQLTRDVTAVTVDDYFERLQQWIGS